MIDPHTWSMNRDGISELYEDSIRNSTKKNIDSYFRASDSWKSLLKRGIRTLEQQTPSLEISCNLTDLREDLREMECMDRAVKHLTVK